MHTSNEDSTLLHNSSSQSSPYPKSDLASDSESKANTEDELGEEDQSESLIGQPAIPCYSNKISIPSENALTKAMNSEATTTNKRKTMEIMKCPHKNQKHYAKVFIMSFTVSGYV